MRWFGKVFGRDKAPADGIAFGDGSAISFQRYGELCTQLAVDGMRSTYTAVLAAEPLGQPSILARIKCSPRAFENLLFVQFCAAQLACLPTALNVPGDAVREAIAGTKTGLTKLAESGAIPKDPAYLHHFHLMIVRFAGAMQEDFNNLPEPGGLDFSGGKAVSQALTSLRDAYTDETEEISRYNDLEELFLVAQLRDIRTVVSHSLIEVGGARWLGSR